MRSLLAILLTLAISNAQAAPPPRKSLDGWGPFKFSMSQAQAAAAVKAKVIPENLLDYECRIAGRNFDARVFFTENRERVFSISLLENHAEDLDETQVVVEYNRLIDLLTEQYGPPDTKGVPVRDDRSPMDGHTVPRTEAVFKFADGASIAVVEHGVGSVREMMIRYLPGAHSENF
jgi:hypothetical protein